MTEAQKLFRTINADIKKTFGAHASFVPCKAGFAGSFSALRFEGPSLTIELADDIAIYVQLTYKTFAPTKTGRPVAVGYFMGATVINWNLSD